MENKKKIPFLEHYHELRSRLLKIFVFFFFSFFFAFFLKNHFLEILLQPYIFVAKYQKIPLENIRLQSTALLEILFVKLKLCIFGAFLISLPFSLYQIYKFILPGFYRLEKKFLFKFSALIIFSFLSGGAFVYFCLTPFMLWFNLLQQNIGNNGLQIKFDLKISEYLDFVMQFIVIFGLIFQFPAIIFFLQKINLFNISSLQKNRRWFLLCSAIFSAIITPPDLLTMLCVLIPLILLYELSIFFLKDNSEQKTDETGKNNA